MSSDSLCCDVCGNGDLKQHIVICVRCTQFAAHTFCIVPRIEASPRYGKIFAFSAFMIRVLTFPSFSLLLRASRDWLCSQCKRIELEHATSTSETTTKCKSPAVNPIISDVVVGEKSVSRTRLLAAKPPTTSRVGAEYQCPVPTWKETISMTQSVPCFRKSMNSRNHVDWSGRCAKMMWCPYRMKDRDVETFLNRFDVSQHECVLHLLHESNYNRSRTFSKAKKQKSAVGPAWKRWSAKDEALFNKAMASLNDKHFGRVREWLPHKSLKDVLQYYYGKWKFTSNHEIWRATCKKRKEYHDEVCEKCEVGGDLMCCDTVCSTRVSLSLSLSLSRSSTSVAQFMNISHVVRTVPSRVSCRVCRPTNKRSPQRKRDMALSILSV